MKGALLNYFFLMKTIKELPNSMTDKFPKDKSAYFNFANFINVSTYSFIYNPFKKDKYKLHELIRNNYKESNVLSSVLLLIKELNESELDKVRDEIERKLNC